jgi:hypothetical protein
MRKQTRVAVLLVWAGVMAVQVARVSGPGLGEESASSLRFGQPLPASAHEAWYGIYRRDDKVGYAVQRRTPIEDGFRIEDRALMKLAVMGAARVVRTEFVAETDPRLVLRRFELTIGSGSLSLQVSGEAEDAGIVLRARSSADAEPRVVRIPLEEPPLLPQTLHGLFARESLVTGAVYRYPLIDPTTGAPSTVELVVGERETIELPEGERDAFRVTQTTRGSQFTLWVDPEGGDVLREEGPLGLVLVRELPSRAVAGTLAAEGLDLGAVAAIAPGTTIATPREAARLELRIGGFPDDLRPSFPPRQSLDGDRLTIATERAEELESYPLPADRQRFAADLGPTLFLESDAPAIRELAASIVGEERDAAIVARRILDWVHEELAKVPSAAWPSALEVLRTRQGDCNEHAVLFAALARAAGLPARIAAGVVYAGGDPAFPDAFYYHAWNEVWLGRWVAIDSVFGQLPADATHVQFLVGGPERHAELVRLLGRVSLSVLDVETRG